MLVYVGICWYDMNLYDGYHTPPKTSMEPENVLLEKEKHRPKPPILRFILGIAPLHPPTAPTVRGNLRLMDIACGHKQVICIILKHGDSMLN